MLPWRPKPDGLPGQEFYELEGLFFAHGTIFGYSGGENGIGGAASAATGWIRTGPWDVVTAYTAEGDTIYIGGASPDGFSEIDGQSRNDLAAINLTTGKLTPWAPNVNRYSFITSMAASGDQILASGDFASTLG